MNDKVSRPSNDHIAGPHTSRSVPHLLVEATDSFNYAAWQNAVPLLRRVTIDNSGGSELSSLVVEVKASPGFAREKRWAIDRVGAGELLTLREIDLEIDPAYLDGLDEAVRGVLTFRITQQGNPLHELNHLLKVLARDEWGGMSGMANLLPAFVTPNDPALAVILKSAGNILEQHGHSTALDGYQSRDPNRAYLLASAIWSALAGRALIYANPPGSFEQVGQKIRRVGTVFNDGLATCLDSTLLFASGLEAVGLNSVLVMAQGHCFVGVWLVEKTFKRLVEQDCSELRKAIAARELIVFETTLITHRPPGRFPDAIAVAANSISEEKESEFVAVIDVARARMSQVLPLASHIARREVEAENGESAPPPLAAPPGYSAAPAEEAKERPSTPTGRIERWQRKLLDLSLRNRLLNFKSSKQTVPVLCPDVSKLEDKLADGTRLRLVSLPDGNPLGQRDSELHQRRTQKDLDWEFARQALERDEVVCPLALPELEARLTALFRKARNDLAEGGSNTLYLAVGFLRWKQTPTDEKVYRAPLLLVPVQLARRSASSPFYLINHEDDVRFNATLLQLLKKDFDCDITALESTLPMDDSGVDVPLVLDRMRQKVRDIPGFEVVEEAAIAPFSFAKYLMWRDMVDRVGQLERNRVVRHLIHEPDKAFSTEGAGPMPRSHEIDTRYTPRDIVHPLPADSSQLAAVMAASEGHDMVIVGPPGTGKSQTIANMIAQCLAVGKTVLFVAEKTAALDVVHRRLREHGLGDCSVELHSNKAEKRRFLDQLESSWNNRVEESISEWITVNEQLRLRRDQLNAYAAAVHTPDTNGWTAYRAMGECVRGSHVTTPRFDWPSSVRHSRTEYAAIEETVAQLTKSFQAMAAETCIQRLEATEWSMSWEISLMDSCHQLATTTESLFSSIQTLGAFMGVSLLKDISSLQINPLYRLANEFAQPELPSAEILQHERLASLQAVLEQRHELLETSNHANRDLGIALSTFCQAIGLLPDPAMQYQKRRPFYRLANELVRTPLPLAELVFHEHFDELQKTLTDRPSLLKAKNEAFAALVARSFNPALIDRIDFGGIDREWVAASKSPWPLSEWKKWKTLAKIKAYMNASAVVQPDVDLPLLRDYVDCIKRVELNLASLNVSPELKATVEKNVSALDTPLQSASRTREVFRAAGLSPTEVGKAARGHLTALVSAARGLFPPAQEVERLRVKLKENLAALGLPAALRLAVEQDARALSGQIKSAINIRESAIALGVSRELSSQALKSILAVPQVARCEKAAECCRLVKALREVWKSYMQLANAAPADVKSPSLLADAAAQARHVITRRSSLRQWTAWIAVRNRAAQLGLSAFVEALQSAELNVGNVMSRFKLAYARWWLPTAIDRLEPLRRFQKFLHEDAIADFRRLDDLARKAAAPRVRHAILHGLPPSHQVPKKSELGLLRHQISLKRPSKSIREMIGGMPDSFGKLAPCLLMSPLSIAQYLPADQAQFDVVIFDEASQIATWDAIGAIARGKQTIIVGDPKQLPPTNFFGKAENDEENEELEDHEKDLESILDEAKASGLPTLQLNWHYRSKHESLIAFSNWHYYGNRLVTFPAAESIDRGVSLRIIDGALYDRGKSRTNRHEAEAIVSELVDRMERTLSRAESQRLTYGVVTFNSQQQELIQDLLDEALRQRPELEWFFADERIEPTVVKNLENVQGDERDVIMFSITFGFDAAGKFPVDFGAINRDGGERRLNVAITRARQELVVFASFLPEQLAAERAKGLGVRDLKEFLEYAQKGPEAIIARIEGSLGGFESPLEEAIAIALETRGWRVETQIGVSGFRIDLGIVHPDKPGAYLAGVECDGATYHRSAVARDRDKIRQQVLENLGWNIVRVWSTDWWYDPNTAIEQLDRALNDLRDQSFAEMAKAQSSTSSEPSGTEEGLEVESANYETCDNEPGDSADRIAEQGVPQESSQRTQLFARHTPLSERRLYSRVDLGDAALNQNRFFDDDYSATLRDMANAVLKSQGPIRDDALAREVARAHGFARTGSQIKQRILDLLPDVTVTEEPVGRFLWPTAAPQGSIPFRYPCNDETRRSIDEISMPELIGLVREHPALAISDDPAIAFAREIGLARLARAARERLESAVEASRCGS